MNVVERKEINYLSLSSDLAELAKIKEDNGNEKMSIFYEFESEQMIMNNVNFKERVHPENAFTITCGFQLHSKRSNYCKK